MKSPYWKSAKWFARLESERLYMTDGVTRSYSQIGQDIWVIEQVFNRKENGYFLEAGGGDGIRYSNTYMLEKDYNWKGICVEPNKNLYSALVENRTSTNINACLGDENGVMSLVDRSLLSRVSDNLNETSEEYEVFVIPKIPLVDLLDQQKAPKVIDYLSLDVEGYEYEIMKNFDFSKYKFMAITIEMVNLPDGIREELDRLFINNGYVCVVKDFISDSFYIHRDIASAYTTPDEWFINSIVKQLPWKSVNKLNILNPALLATTDWFANELKHKEEAEQRKAEEEQRNAEEEQRNAEEEQRKAEEERKAEEGQRKAEALNE